jgi:hypothetical protein
MPDEPINQERAEGIGFLLGNQVFDDQLARRTAAPVTSPETVK